MQKKIKFISGFDQMSRYAKNLMWLHFPSCIPTSTETRFCFSDNFIDFCENVEKIKKSQVNKELMFISDGQEKNETKPTKSDIPNIPNIPPTPDTISEDQVSIKIPGTKNQNQVTSV